MGKDVFLKNIVGVAKTSISNKMAILFLLFSIGSHSQPYSIDPTFGTNGLVTGPNCLYGVDVIFSGNKYYMIGRQGLYAINYDGTLDTTFGWNGFISLQTTSDPIYLVKNAKISGDFIYLFGLASVSSSDYNAFIAKFNLTTGIPDTTFGPNGIKTIDFGAKENCTDILFGTPQETSFYVVINRSIGSNDATTYIVKMFLDGTLDTSFDPLGYKTYTLGEGLYGGQLFNYQEGLLLTGIIKIDSGNTDFCMVKLSTNGTIMTSFGTNGSIVVPISWGFTHDLVNSKLTSDNKVYACTHAAFSSNTRSKNIFRYDLNTNVVTHANQYMPINFGQFSIASDGKVYFPGYDGSQGSGSMVRRFNENLTLDTSFNGYGSYSVRFETNTGPGAYSNCSLAYAHDDGKVFLGGNQPTQCAIGARRILPGVLGLSQFEEDIFSIVPNPVNDYLEINSKNEIEIKKIIIADITGKKVLQRNGNNLRIDTQSLQSGLYFLEVHSETVKSTIKFIKR